MSEDNALLARIESIENMIQMFIKAMDHQNRTIDVLRGQVNSLELSRKKEDKRIVMAN